MRSLRLRVELVGDPPGELAARFHAHVVGVNGPLSTGDVDMTIQAAVDGIGLAFSLEDYVAPQLASGALVRVLEDWCPPFAGFFLYYPSRRQQLAALIDTLRL